MVIDPRAKWRGKQIKPEEFAFLPEEAGSSRALWSKIEKKTQTKWPSNHSRSQKRVTQYSGLDS